MGVCDDVLAIWTCSCCNDAKVNVKNSIIHQRFLQCAGMFMVLDIAFPYL
jgi:hypothetical protein